MVIRLDAERVDITSASAVIRHVQGRVIHTTLGTFLDRNVVLYAPLPSGIVSLMSVVYTATLPRNIPGFRVRMDTQAMIWHNVGVTDLIRTMDTAIASMEMMFVPMWVEREPSFFVTTRRLMGAVADDYTHWSSPLPCLEQMLRQQWPCVADIFCAESSSIHGMMRLPTFAKSDYEDLLAWAGTTMGACSSTDNTGTDHNHRPARRTRGPAPPAAHPRRRRGVRKWVMLSVSPARRASDAAPEIVVQLVEWVFRALRHGLAGRPVPEPLVSWIAVPTDDLINQATANPSLHPLLFSLLSLTVQIATSVPAHSSRGRSGAHLGGAPDRTQRHHAMPVQQRPLAPER